MRCSLYPSMETPLRPVQTPLSQQSATSGLLFGCLSHESL
jgi:hypothetical protein